MKPLNKKERTKAYYKVIGLFLLSFVIAIILGFSTMNLSKISEISAETELEKLQENLHFQQEVFAPNVGKSVDLLKKIPDYEAQGENLEVLNQDIGAIISATKNQVQEDETWESKMYLDVLKTLSDLQLAYNDHFELLEQLEDSGNSDEKLQRCLNEKQQLQNQVNILQASGGGGNNKQLQKDLKDAEKKLRDCILENRALKQEIQKYESR